MIGKCSVCIFVLYIVVLKEYIFDFLLWLYIDFILFLFFFLLGNVIRGIFMLFIVFYVLMLSNEFNVGIYYLFIFDYELFNVRNGYYFYLGVFIVLESGIYVFMWIF